MSDSKTIHFFTWFLTALGLPELLIDSGCYYKDFFISLTLEYTYSFKAVLMKILMEGNKIGNKRT